MKYVFICSLAFAGCAGSEPSEGGLSGTDLAELGATPGMNVCKSRTGDARAFIDDSSGTTIDEFPINQFLGNEDDIFFRALCDRNGFGNQVEISLGLQPDLGLGTFNKDSSSDEVGLLIDNYSASYMVFHTRPAERDIVAQEDAENYFKPWGSHYRTRSRRVTIDTSEGPVRRSHRVHEPEDALRERYRDDFEITIDEVIVENDAEDLFTSHEYHGSAKFTLLPYRLIRGDDDSEREPVTLRIVF